VSWRRWLPVRRLAPRLQVRSKTGRLVPFNLNAQQTVLLEALESGEDVLVLKPRQIGASTLVAYWFFWVWFTSPDPVTLVILSYKQKSSKHLLRMVRGFYDALPVELRRPLSVSSSTAMELEDSGAEVLAMGAQDDGGTRSFTAQGIWLSEFAFAPNGAELLATTEGSLAPGGQVVAESTANHWGDALHMAIQKTERGEASWRVLFFPWRDVPEYSCPDDGQALSDDDEQYRVSNNLTRGQMLWRLAKVSKIGDVLFRREYPLTVSDAYSQAAGAYFSDAVLGLLAVHEGASSGRCLLVDAQPGHVYVAGFDPSGGVGLDDSSLTVLDVTAGRVVATWRSNVHTFDEALAMVSDTVLRYGARLAIEYNNHGHGYFEAIRSGYTGAGVRLFTEEGKPPVTSTRSRALLWSGLRQAIETGAIVEVDSATLTDLRMVAVDEVGRVVLPRTSAGHCDGAVSLALAVLASRGLSVRRRNEVDRLILKTRADRLKSRAGVGLRRYS